MRRLLLLFCMSASVLGYTAPEHMRILAAGSEVGACNYEMRPDGTFTSKTSIAIAGISIKSNLSGKIVDGLLTEYKFDLTRDESTYAIEASGTEARTFINEKVTTTPFKPAKYYFGNYHPFLSGSLLQAALAGGDKEAAVELLIVDGARVLPIHVLLRASRKIDRDGKVEAVRAFQMRFGTVDIDAYVDDSGRVVAWDVPSQRLQMVADGYDGLFVDPATLYPELSQPALKSRAESKVMVPMRDGVKLAAELVRPADEGKYPAILLRTPYGRGASAIEGGWWASRGYVLVSQDVRGRGDSEGDWNPFFNERKDGYDTIEWIARQPWSNGKVGMIGGSYLGLVQWQAAVEQPEALKCIIPQVSPPDPFFNIPFDHGIPFLFGSVWWARVVMDRVANMDIFRPIDSVEGLLKLPITEVENAILGRDVPFVNDWWKRDTASAFAGVNYQDDLNKVNIPALMISGWWDGDGIGTKMNFAKMSALGKPNQYLIYGPWTHAFNTTTKLGDVDYGSGAILELNSLYLRWFDQWLKGKDVMGSVPKVQVFLTGANEWRVLDGWPDSDSKESTLFLSSTGPANGGKSAGKLVAARPGDEKPETYVYDPAAQKVDPKMADIDPSKATTVVHLKDETQDVLMFRTDVLTDPVDMAGPISLQLYFATTAVDTDFFVSLMDVDPQGVTRMVCLPGKIRAKYIESYDEPRLLTPGKTYEASIDLWDVAHRFLPGHRIAITITSESFPSYARNLNTGEPPATGTRMVAATQTIFHDAKRPSALRFRHLPDK